MRLLVSECERYFTRPLCGDQHAHTQDCWHEDLQNALSDVRAMTNRANYQEEQLKTVRHERDLLQQKSRAVMGYDGGIKGGSASFVWVDELAAYSVDAREFAKADRAEKQLNELARPTYKQDPRVRRIERRDGVVAYQTPDGKQFTTADAAQRHASLLGGI